jgi:DNA-binding NarL/FixJ family response regulator
MIASPQKIVGSVLGSLLSNEPDMTVVGQAQSTIDLLAHAETARPDLVLVEWSLLDRTETGTIQALHRLTDPPQVIVYGWQPDASQRALDAGADAFFWEGAGPKALLTMARRILLERRCAQ